MEAILLENPEITYPWVSRADLLSQKDRLKRNIIIDVRTPSEFREAHIPDSTNIPLADLNHYIPQLESAAQRKKIVLVCRTQNRAKIAYEQLLNAGVNCQMLEGGLQAWKESGDRVIKGKNSISLERQVRMVAGGLVMLGGGLGLGISPWFHLLPMAVGAGLLHAGLTDSCFMAMVLGNLPFNRKSGDAVKL